MARYIYTDSSLRVIGIAAVVEFRVVNYTEGHDPYKDYHVDYFRLYEVYSTTNEMILLADKPLTDTSIACYLPNGTSMPMFGRKPKGVPVREVYFNSAITVHDSFYVAVTCNNNYRRVPSQDKGHIITIIPGQWIMDPYGHPTVLPQPNHYRRKLHLVNGYDEDLRYATNDTNWHVYHTNRSSWDTLIMTDPIEWGYFMMMFPILDTTPDHSWLPECKRPVNFGAIHVGKEVVVLGWESEGSGRWELKVAKEGEDLESVEAVSCTDDVLPLYGLDTATWYVATVRSACGENRFSQWNDTIRFFVPGDTTSTNDPDDLQEGVETLAEMYTYMMPNPASEQVTVMSSFRIDRVEVYSLTGQRLLQENVGGLSSQIDISSLPKGGYLVRIHTNRGISTKRLVVK